MCARHEVGNGSSMSNRLHVGNLAVTTTAATLTEVFQRDGRTVARVSLVMSRDPGVSRGFAFVEMGSEVEANSALAALQGADVDGKALRVSIAHGPKSRFGGTVGGHGGPVRAPTAASIVPAAGPA
jgi:cold-inducible RNA-binding protein